MTDEQILKKAIEKAEKNNFHYFPANFFPANFVDNKENWDALIDYGDYYKVIFSHNFAKAFYSEKIEYHFGVPFRAMDWHLREMVIEKKPLKYLEKFL